MIEAPRVRIKEERLKQLLEGINQFGRNPSTGGFNRMGFSKADMAARDWLAEVMAVEGLSVHRDAATNVFGRYGPRRAPASWSGRIWIRCQKVVPSTALWWRV